MKCLTRQQSHTFFINIFFHKAQEKHFFHGCMTLIFNSLPPSSFWTLTQFFLFSKLASSKDWISMAYDPLAVEEDLQYFSLPLASLFLADSNGFFWSSVSSMSEPPPNVAWALAKPYSHDNLANLYSSRVGDQHQPHSAQSGILNRWSVVSIIDSKPVYILFSFHLT